MRCISCNGPISWWGDRLGKWCDKCALKAQAELKEIQAAIEKKARLQKLEDWVKRNHPVAPWLTGKDATISINGTEIKGFNADFGGLDELVFGGHGDTPQTIRKRHLKLVKNE